MKVFYFIPIIILILSLNLLIFDTGFYQKNVPAYESYKENVQDILSFFLGGDLSPIYTEQEQIHMHDVRSRIWLSWIIFLVCSTFIGIKLYNIPTKDLKKELWKGGLLTIGILLLTGIASQYFSQIFLLFHQVIFTNNYWLLPPDALLIQMFPQEFFLKSMLQILLYSFIFSILIIIVGLTIPEVRK
ncbi:DUF1461 domain-containing protein [Candidatus Woesearchaeota archaeon]|nr:DUF1461 domain-containing protein [Candidatus Woesearchaeota archaeon]